MKKDKQLNRQTVSQADSQMDRQTASQSDGLQADSRMKRKTDRQTFRQGDRQKDGQTDRWIDNLLYPLPIFLSPHLKTQQFLKVFVQSFT